MDRGQSAGRSQPPSTTTRTSPGLGSGGGTSGRGKRTTQAPGVPIAAQQVPQKLPGSSTRPPQQQQPKRASVSASTSSSVPPSASASGSYAPSHALPPPAPPPPSSVPSVPPPSSASSYKAGPPPPPAPSSSSSSSAASPPLKLPSAISTAPTSSGRRPPYVHIADDHCVPAPHSQRTTKPSRSLRATSPAALLSFAFNRPSPSHQAPPPPPPLPPPRSPSPSSAAASSAASTATTSTMHQTRPPPKHRPLSAIKFVTPPSSGAGSSDSPSPTSAGTPTRHRRKISLPPLPNQQHHNHNNQQHNTVPAPSPPPSRPLSASSVSSVSPRSPRSTSSSISPRSRASATLSSTSTTPTPPPPPPAALTPTSASASATRASQRRAAARSMPVNAAAIVSASPTSPILFVMPSPTRRALLHLDDSSSSSPSTSPADDNRFYCASAQHHHAAEFYDDDVSDNDDAVFDDDDDEQPVSTAISDENHHHHDDHDHYDDDGDPSSTCDSDELQHRRSLGATGRTESTSHFQVTPARASPFSTEKYPRRASLTQPMRPRRASDPERLLPLESSASPFAAALNSTPPPPILSFSAPPENEAHLTSSAPIVTSPSAPARTGRSFLRRLTFRRARSFDNKHDSMLLSPHSATAPVNSHASASSATSSSSSSTSGGGSNSSNSSSLPTLTWLHNFRWPRHTSNSNSSSSSSSSSSSASLPALNMASVASNENSLFERTRRIFLLSFADQRSSVHVDLPRLITKMSIVDMRDVSLSTTCSNGSTGSNGDGDLGTSTTSTSTSPSSVVATDFPLVPAEEQVVFAPASLGSLSTEEKLGRFLRTLAEQLDDTSSVQAIDQGFEQLVVSDQTRDGELSLRLRSFLIENLGQEARTCLLLRACSQGIIAPLVVAMNAGRLSPRSKAKQRAALNSFNSVRGSWRLTIILRDHQVVVRHQKKEQTNNEAHNFVFEWRADLILSPSLTELLDLHVDIGDLEFVDSDSITPKYQAKVRKRMIERLRTLVLA